MRRQAERLFECPAEIMRAQADKPCQCGERDTLGKVLLDMRDDSPLLPTGEAPGRASVRPPLSAVEPHELMRQHRAYCLEVEPIFRPGTIHRIHQLERGIAQRGVLEE